MAFCRTWTEY